MSTTVANTNSNAKQQRNPQICGVSSPISILPPKEIDFQLTKKLKECLRSFDQFESEEEMNHRMQVLSSINELVMKWVQNVSLQKKMPPEIAAQMNGKIFTFGSFRLGVHTKGAEIGTLLVAPRHIDHTDFFTSFAEQLTALKTCEYVRTVEDAFVPVIKTKIDGIFFSIYLLNVRLQVHKVCQILKLTQL
ncbi:poly(A) polymerase gamma-like protein [Dinothrombium tinctorium]|uniref:Poly(A) polymerase gamma-like protein n=1 Tax=Dinothrombium tinctorium TaxID=1965070 RepID=A0A443Q827_9ACAR|nr:poly(A) polymerase gamma-like protein [Dinothrombium tinctorium]